MSRPHVKGNELGGIFGWGPPSLRILVRAALLSLALAFVLVLPAFAQEGSGGGGGGEGVPASLEPASAASPFATFDDGGQWEMGLEGTAGNLPQATAAERYGLRYWLEGWFATRFNFNEATSWEEDFKRAAMGGTENIWLDSVDLGFYVGHGSAGRITFDNASHDDGAMDAWGDCYASWGDNDNEWLAITSCQVLSNPGVAPMAYCMNRQHLILGFVTNASAHNNFWETQAYHYGLRLRYAWNQTQAWFGACDAADRDRIVRVIAEETACFNDNPYYSSTCGDTLDSDYYWYTHDCGTETATQVPLAALGGQLPVFKVTPYSTAEANADYRNLSGAFNIPLSQTVQAAEIFGGVNPPTNTVLGDFKVSYGVSSTLSMDQSSGLYQYTDNANLWTQSAAEAAMLVNAASPNYITGDDAKAIADNFLNTHGLMDDGATFYEVITDTTGSMPEKDPQVSAAAIADAEVPTNYQVIYSRKLPVDLITAAGGTLPFSLTVVGPGSKLKVYVPLQGAVGAASVLGTAPIGALGGWRGVEPALNAASQQLMTSLISTPTVQALFLTLDDEATMNSIPALVQNPVVISMTVAYWEMVAGSSQGELIPVYELSVDYTDGNTGSASHDLFYVPAGTEYLRPLARILNAPEAMLPGTKVTLNAADAAKTLEENGIGAPGEFPFTMGYLGADGAYAYAWYMGAPDDANKIDACDGQKKCEITAPMSVDGKSSFDVMLMVTDADSPNQSEATAMATIAMPALFLPTVIK